MSQYSVPEPKIRPGRRRGGGVGTARVGSDLRPDGTPDDDDRVEIGPTPLACREWEEAGVRVPDLAVLREYRLERLRGELRRDDCAGLLLIA